MTSLHAMLKMAESNKTLPCPVNGCTNKRTGVSRYCSAHRKRKVRYGDVNGRPINKSEYQRELLEVREFFIKHEGHPALNSGVYFFQSWMTKAAAGDASVGLKTMGKLYREGVSARECLEEVVAIWVYAMRKPMAIPDDLRLTYTLARNLIRMGKFNSKTSSGGNNYTQSPNPNELKAVGEYLRHSLARFVLNVNHALKAEHEAETSIKENLSLPFDQ